MSIIWFKFKALPSKVRHYIFNFGASLTWNGTSLLHCQKLCGFTSYISRMSSISKMVVQLRSSPKMLVVQLCSSPRKDVGVALLHPQNVGATSLNIQNLQKVGAAPPPLKNSNAAMHCQIFFGVVGLMSILLLLLHLISRHDVNYLSSPHLQT